MLGGVCMDIGNKCDVDHFSLCAGQSWRVRSLATYFSVCILVLKYMPTGSG